MELRLATEEELRTAYERDLTASFPRSELKPLREMLTELRLGEYRPWCLFDGEELLGEAFTWVHEPGFALFDYLCVAPARRNDGLGSELIRRLVEAERGNVLFGESEIPRYADDPALAERRVGFYLRNGAKKAGYDVCEFGVPYHTLFWADRPLGDAELCAAQKAAYRSSLPAEAFERCIQIPWEPSMGFPERVAWMGRDGGADA